MSSFDQYRTIMANIYNNEITHEQAVQDLNRLCSPEDLAEILVDAFDRGWIEPWNLGINEDGQIA